MTQLSLFKKHENKRVKTCAFTGHRRLNNDCSEERVKQNIRSLIEAGFELFYNGMAMGFDLLCAECVLSLKEEFPCIQLVACLPCNGQERNYSQQDKIRYAEILKRADKCLLLSEEYYQGCMLARDRYMADNADILMAYKRKSVGGTAYTVNYFEKHYPERDIIFL